MNPDRRTFLRASTAATAATAAMGAGSLSELAKAAGSRPAPHPLLTPAPEFQDVSRGKPKPFDLVGEALEEARLTPETWRIEILADPFTDAVVKEPASLERQFRLDDGSALDFAALRELGRTRGVRYLKAMQCLNIAEPLGQGLWEGVPLREILRLCGAIANVRRIHYHGFHNDDPAQLFRSSLSYSEAMETPPGEPPVLLAWKLNGEPLSLLRGGPVRMVVPWAYGFKSIKWLRSLSLTNDYRANDTYAERNNDPDSPVKTAAYLDPVPDRIESGTLLHFTGRVVSGRSGLDRVEYALRRDGAGESELVWNRCELEAPPADWSAVLPPGVSSREVLGFDPGTGAPLSWPPRYGTATWFASPRDLPPGGYEILVRAIDRNGFAQPEPRPMPKAGKNAVESRRFEVG